MRLVGTILYTGVLGATLNVRYSGLGDGGPVEDFLLCVDMVAKGSWASRYQLFRWC